MKEVVVSIPSQVFSQRDEIVAREILELAVLAAYQSEVISLGRLAEILNFSIHEAHGFLKKSRKNSKLAS